MSVIAVPAASRAQEHFRTLAILSVGLTWAIAKNKARLRAGDPSLFLRFSLCGVNFHIIIGRAHFLLSTPSNILFFFFPENPFFLNDFKILETKVQKSC